MAYRAMSTSMQAMLDRLRAFVGWASIDQIEPDPVRRGPAANTLLALVRMGLAEQCRGQYRAAREKP